MTRVPADNKRLAAYLKRLAKDFAFFYVELSSSVGLEPPGRARLDIAWWMQHGPPRRGVLAARKVGKTFIACAYDLWRLYRNSQEQILETSQSADFAKASVLLERKWIDAVAFLRHLRPRRDMYSHDRDNVIRFDVGTARTELLHSASVSAIGITGQVPGTGATLVRPDDVETKENTLTRAARKLLEERIEELEHALLPDGQILYLGTPHHEESVYRKLLNRGYVFRAWPLVYPTPSEEIPGLAPMLVEDMKSGRAQAGDPVFPDIFNREACLVKKLSMSAAGWAMQCMLRTDLLEVEEHPLCLSDFILFDIQRDKAPASLAWGRATSRGSTAREDIPSVGFGDDCFYAPIMVDELWLPYHGTKAFIDPAGRGEDEIAWAIVSQLHGYLYLKFVGGLMGGPSVANLETIVQSLRTHGASELYIEPNFGGDMLAQLIEPVIRRLSLKPNENDLFPTGWNCAPMPTKHAAGQKEVRLLDAIGPPLQQHRIVISPLVARNEEFSYQLVHLTRERNCLEHDDRVDAFAGVLRQWLDALDQDAIFLARRKSERLLIARLKSLRHFWGPKIHTPSWCHSPTSAGIIRH